MRIPFLRKRERNPVLYNKGIEDEYELNRKARSYATKLFMGTSNPDRLLDFVFEQVFIIYSLAMSAGSQEVSDKARNALCMLRKEYEALMYEDLYSFKEETAVACSVALTEGVAVLQELPRSEFKLVYVQVKRITETRSGITNYLRSF